MYCLWIGAQKIYNLKQLIRHFDFDTVEMYLLGGGLSRWLRQCGETEIAEKTDKIDLLGDISRQLSEVFSVRLPKGRSNIPAAAANGKRPDAPRNGPGSFAPYEQCSFISDDISLSSFPTDTGSFRSESGSFWLNTSSFRSEIGSFELRGGSFELQNSSFSYGSFGLSLYTGSFETTSFNLSGLTSSFGFGGIYGSFFTNSFHFHEYEYESDTSFNLTSFGIGSFTPGSFDMGSFGANYYNNNTNDGTLGENKEKTCFAPAAVQLTPEEKIRLNISSCYLNRFGYGLHLI